MMKCTGAGLTHYDRALHFTRYGPLLVSGNVGLEAVTADMVWVGIAPGGERQRRFLNRPVLGRAAVAVDAGADEETISSLSRTEVPVRPARVPEEVTTWLAMDGNESRRQTGWSAKSTTAWLGRTGGKWQAALLFEAEPGATWNLRDRMKHWAEELSPQFLDDTSVTFIRESQRAGVSVTFDDQRLDEAWAFMLSAARVRSLSPAEPMIVELSPTTYRVEAKDVEGWRRFYWADAFLALYRSDVLIWNAAESPAGLLGLRHGDIILAIDGTLIRSIDDIEPAVMKALEQQASVIQLEIQRRRGTPPMTLRYELGR